jgi:hypothetical protein
MDADRVWKILEPTIRAGETYTLPRDFTREQSLQYWYSPNHEVFVAKENGEGNSEILGTYYLRANQQGGGSHVANCGYMTAPWATGRGIAGAILQKTCHPERSGAESKDPHEQSSCAFYSCVARTRSLLIPPQRWNPNAMVSALVVLRK